MALYNNMIPEDFKRQSNAIATEVERTMRRAQEFSERMAGVSEVDSGLGADYYAQVMSMRTDLAALVTWYNANVQFVDRFCQLTTY